MHYPDCDGDGDISKGDTSVQGELRSCRERAIKKKKRRNTVLGNIKIEAKAKKNPPCCSIRWTRKQVLIL